MKKIILTFYDSILEKQFTKIFVDDENAKFILDLYHEDKRFRDVSHFLTDLVEVNI